MAIIDRNFRGEVPKLPPHELPQGAAQLALNCDLRHGDIRPLRTTSLVASDGGLAGAKGIYTEDGSSFAAFTRRAAVVRHPTNGVNRLFFADGTGLYGTRGVPQLAASPGSAYALTNTLRIGLPTPGKAPVVSVVEKSPWPFALDFSFYVEANGQQITAELTAASISSFISMVSGSNNRQYDLRIPQSAWPKDKDGKLRTDVNPVACAIFSASGRQVSRIWSNNSTRANSSTSAGVMSYTGSQPQASASSVMSAVRSHVSSLGSYEEKALQQFGASYNAMTTADLQKIYDQRTILTGITWDGNGNYVMGGYGGDDATILDQVVAANAILRARNGGLSVGSILGAGTSGAQTGNYNKFVDYDVRIDAKQQSWPASGDTASDIIYRYTLQFGQLETRRYVYTYLTPYGEESGPSPASESVNVDAFQDVKLTFQESPPAGYGITGGRLYRTATGLSGQTSWLYVAGGDQASESTDWTAPSWFMVDTVSSANLGEVLPSLGWHPPPVNLAGLCPIGNGSLAGFAGAVLAFSEPYRPHAWPTRYQMTFPEPIIAISPYGVGLMVATTKGFYVVSGTTAGSFSRSRLPEEAQLFGDQMVTSNGAIVVPTLAGMGAASGNGIDLTSSRSFWEKEDWTQYISAFGTLSTIAANNGRIFVFATNGGFIADLATGILSRHSMAGVTAARYVPKLDAIFAVQGGTLVKIDDITGAQAVYTYRSRVFRHPMPVNYSAAKVFASGPVTVKVIADGVPRFYATVPPNTSFRLPSGFKAVEWYYELAGTATVTEVRIAESILGLRNG